MEFKIECPWCNQHYSVDDSFVGQTVECSVCGKEFVVKKPNDPVVVVKPKTEDSFHKEKETNKPNVSPNHNLLKGITLSKNTIKIGILVFAALVIVLIPLCVLYHMKNIPEKEYNKGLKAYSDQRYEEAIAFFQKAVEHGHKKALAEINYINGEKAFKEHRFEDAINYYMEAEELGHANAKSEYLKAQKEQQKALAEIYYTNGEMAFKEHRFEEAINYYKKAEKSGHAKAKAGYIKAEKEQQNILSQTNLRKAKNAIDEHRFEEAVRLLQDPASQGNSEAQFLLGTCYYNGEGIKKDPDEAAKWFRKSAEQGDIDAQYKLGLCYLTGAGVAFREDEAIYWLQKAAEQGHPKAQIALGDLYYKKGSNQDFSKAFEWYQKARVIAVSSRAEEWLMCTLFSEAEKGDAKSQYLFYELYREGNDGIEKNEQEALKWLRRSANSGYPKAEFDLSEVYKLGKYGVRKNETEEIKWLKKAAEHGNDSAQIVMGTYYLAGTDSFEKDRREARKWLRKAAIQDAPENRTLVRFLLLGSYMKDDVPINMPAEEIYAAGRDELVKKYRKPAEKGDIEAMLIMGDCCLLGFGTKQDFQKALE